MCTSTVGIHDMDKSVVSVAMQGDEMSVRTRESDREPGDDRHHGMMGIYRRREIPRVSRDRFHTG